MPDGERPVFAVIFVLVGLLIIGAAWLVDVSLGPFRRRTGRTEALGKLTEEAILALRGTSCTHKNRHLSSDPAGKQQHHNRSHIFGRTRSSRALEL